MVRPTVSRPGPTGSTPDRWVRTTASPTVVRAAPKRQSRLKQYTPTSVLPSSATAQVPVPHWAGCPTPSIVTVGRAPQVTRGRRTSRVIRRFVVPDGCGLSMCARLRPAAVLGVLGVPSVGSRAWLTSPLPRPPSSGSNAPRRDAGTSRSSATPACGWGTACTCTTRRPTTPRTSRPLPSTSCASTGSGSRRTRSRRTARTRSGPRSCRSTPPRGEPRAGLVRRRSVVERAPLEPDEPRDAERVADGAVPVAPRALLQRVDHGAVGRQVGEPALEHVRFRGAEECEEDAGGREGLVARPGVGCGEPHGADELAVGDRLGWAVGAGEVAVRGDPQLAAEHLLPPGEGHPRGAGEQEVRGRSAAVHARTVPLTGPADQGQVISRARSTASAGSPPSCCAHHSRAACAAAARVLARTVTRRSSGRAPSWSATNRTIVAVRRACASAPPGARPGFARMTRSRCRVVSTVSAGNVAPARYAARRPSRDGSSAGRASSSSVNRCENSASPPQTRSALVGKSRKSERRLTPAASATSSIDTTSNPRSSNIRRATSDTASGSIVRGRPVVRGRPGWSAAGVPMASFRH
ncbi:hypothetical protein Cus16_2098 [Curtobacterium sp. ER1/6]|nr:hypothetical protein Cus16_2098 [Curtobacterium sp. ER1/6]